MGGPLRLGPPGDFLSQACPHGTSRSLPVTSSGFEPDTRSQSSAALNVCLGKLWFPKSTCLSLQFWSSGLSHDFPSLVHVRSIADLSFYSDFSLVITINEKLCFYMLDWKLSVFLHIFLG